MNEQLGFLWPEEAFDASWAAASSNPPDELDLVSDHFRAYVERCWSLMEHCGVAVDTEVRARTLLRAVHLAYARVLRHSILEVAAREQEESLLFELDSISSGADGPEADLGPISGSALSVLFDAAIDQTGGADVILEWIIGPPVRHERRIAGPMLGGLAPWFDEPEEAIRASWRAFVRSAVPYATAPTYAWLGGTWAPILIKKHDLRFALEAWRMLRTNMSTRQLIMDENTAIDVAVLLRTAYSGFLELAVGEEADYEVAVWAEEFGDTREVPDVDESADGSYYAADDVRVEDSESDDDDEDAAWDGDSVPSAKESFLWQRINSLVPTIADALTAELAQIGASLDQFFIDPFGVSHAIAGHPIRPEDERAGSESAIEPDSWSEWLWARSRVEQLFVPDR